MTHDELVIRAVRWLRYSARCGVAIPEPVTYSDEQPDALGWLAQGAICILVECKTSRADFKVDQNKTFRKQPRDGIGNRRYYMTLPGLLTIDELPKGWGLLEVHDKRIVMARDSIDFEIAFGNMKSEQFMYAYLRRAQSRGVLTKCMSKKWRGVLVKSTIDGKQ